VFDSEILTQISQELTDHCVSVLDKMKGINLFGLYIVI